VPPSGAQSDSTWTLRAPVIDPARRVSPAFYPLAVYSPPSRLTSEDRQCRIRLSLGELPAASAARARVRPRTRPSRTRPSSSTVPSAKLARPTHAKAPSRIDTRGWPASLGHLRRRPFAPTPSPPVRGGGFGGVLVCWGGGGVFAVVGGGCGRGGVGVGGGGPQVLVGPVMRAAAAEPDPLFASVVDRGASAPGRRADHVAAAEPGMWPRVNAHSGSATSPTYEPSRSADASRPNRPHRPTGERQSAATDVDLAARSMTGDNTVGQPKSAGKPSERNAEAMSQAGGRQHPGTYAINPRARYSRPPSPGPSPARAASELAELRASRPRISCPFLTQRPKRVVRCGVKSRGRRSTDAAQARGPARDLPARSAAPEPPSLEYS